MSPTIRQSVLQTNSVTVEHDNNTVRAEYWGNNETYTHSLINSLQHRHDAYFSFFGEHSRRSLFWNHIMKNVLFLKLTWLRREEAAGVADALTQTLDFGFGLRRQRHRQEVVEVDWMSLTLGQARQAAARRLQALLLQDLADAGVHAWGRQARESLNFWLIYSLTSCRFVQINVFSYV